MKHLFSSALLALMTFPVLANFVGLEYDVVAESEFGTTYRVYAKFDNTTDEVVAVYALETAPMNVAVSTTFYQAPVGGAFAQGINPLFFSAFPELQYDSWFTIGSADANGTSDVQQVGMDAYFNSFENGGGFYIDTFIGGSWFVLPNQSADAEADENGRVLVAQLTTDGVVNLTLNFQWDDETTETFNDEGVTLSFPTVAVLGCTNPNADNYDANATEDDGSCTFGGGLCTGLSYELVASDPLGSGQSTYRVYANFSDPNVEVTAMYGTDTEPWELIGSDPFFQDALGGDFGGGINPLFFAAFPTLEYDTWWTIGAEPGDADGLNSAFDQALTSFADWNNGGDFIVNTFIGGSVFVVPGANAQGVPVNGRVLLAQVTTSGETSALINLQFRDALQFSHYAVGMTLTFPVAGAGCNDPLACNYDETAEGDADCVYAQTYYDCDGCINDADGDGVCDELEVSGCTDDGACNFDINATEDDGSCLTLDGCGVCGGDNSTCTGCTNADADNYDPNAIFDDGSCIVSGCTNADADNYNPDANNDDGSCIISGCTNADADNYNPEANNDDGSCIVSGCTNADADNYNPDANNDDGSCIISGCTNADADNYNPEANNDDGSCIISGCTNADADNYNPEANNDDGSCIISGCTNADADNYNPEANNDDGSCIISGCTNPSAPNFDPNANNDDGSCLLTGCTYVGADNYDPANTVEDGSCIMSGCTDSTAENYIAYANNDDGSCVYEPCGTGSACPYDSNDDGEIGSADLLAFLVAYGQACSDLGN
jgi:hypothetical protein